MFGKAEIKTSEILGSWVASNVSYLSGDELPDENVLKYSYTKYTFEAPDKMYFAAVYHVLGSEFRYELKGNRILLKSAVGYLINTFRIMELTNNRLILISADLNGSLDSPTSLRYTFYREGFIQQNLPLSPNDIYKVNGTDTLFNSGQKIYALFKGTDFSEHISHELYKVNVSTRTGTLHATFIVDANGKADGLKIIQGINPAYDKAYTKIFYAARNNWKPATRNGRPVRVLMYQEKKYFTSDEAIPSFFNSQKANQAYHNKDYETALYYYDQALATRPDETTDLYHRGICKQMLGNLAGACSDWNKVKALKSDVADGVMAKYCN
ncbi:hypothetical protein DU508_23285 [Pedobacter chinensis]|uniref:TonB C-terminal domain-containing protein n=2 Tax=Pedobacter chinensis TaxID=2282421 RepID=A0A369PTV7_9SPHI|nr:hypothetical protein DU508_23285 [Pedobacter chinensis]